MYFYSTGPIDDWFGWQPYEDTLEKAYSEQAEWKNEKREPFDGIPDYVGLLQRLATKSHLGFAKYCGWEGDTTGGEYIAGFPADHSGPSILFALKQSNNGTTFVASPIELPWLGEPGGIDR